jgi:hypothetical protein
LTLSTGRCDVAPLHHIGVTLRFAPHAKWRISVKHFCSNIRHSARSALLALALQFAVLPLSHVERAAAQSVTTASFNLMPAEFVDAGSLAVASLAASADTTQPVCAICAVATVSNTALLAIPPLFLLPHAVELLNLSVGAEFVRLKPTRAKHAS